MILLLIYDSTPTNYTPTNNCISAEADELWRPLLEQGCDMT